MGKRGPKPQPQTILKMTGSRKAASRPGEPEIPPSRPTKPDWLNAGASAKWDELLPKLEQQGLMAELYGDFLALYCQAYGDLLEAERLLEENGAVAKSRTGAPYTHPAVNMKSNAVERMRKFGQSFGMSPGDVRDVTKVEQKQDALAASARKRG